MSILFDDQSAINPVIYLIFYHLCDSYFISRNPSAFISLILHHINDSSFTSKIPLIFIFLLIHHINGSFNRSTPTMQWFLWHHISGVVFLFPKSFLFILPSFNHNNVSYIWCVYYVWWIKQQKTSSGLSALLHQLIDVYIIRKLFVWFHV